MHEVDEVLAKLEPETAQTADSALSWLLGAEGERAPLSSVDQLRLQHLLWRKLPVSWLTEDAEHHEIAWALGDFFEAAGLDRYAAICRDRRTHEILAAWHRDEDEGSRRSDDAQVASGVLPPKTDLLEFGPMLGPVEAQVHHAVSVLLEQGIAEGALDPGRRGFRAAAQRRMDGYLQRPTAELAGELPLRAVWKERADDWMASFRGAPEGFWQRALPGVHDSPPVPDRVDLSLAPVVAILDAVGDGVQLTGAGYLPPRVALALDERFEWSQEYALGRPRGEADVRQLGFLDEHLRQQRVLTKRGGRLSVSAAGKKAQGDPAALWSAVVCPGPRWREGFEREALAVVCAAVLGQERPTSTSVVDEATTVLATKWRPRAGDADEDGTVGDAADWVWLEWYRLGIPLGWWDERRLGGGLHPTPYGRAACASLFRSVATGPRRMPG